MKGLSQREKGLTNKTQDGGPKNTHEVTPHTHTQSERVIVFWGVMMIKRKEILKVEGF